MHDKAAAYRMIATLERLRIVRKLRDDLYAAPSADATVREQLAISIAGDEGALRVDGPLVALRSVVVMCEANIAALKRGNECNDGGAPSFEQIVQLARDELALWGECWDAWGDVDDAARATRRK